MSDSRADSAGRLGPFETRYSASGTPPPPGRTSCRAEQVPVSSACAVGRSEAIGAGDG